MINLRHPMDGSIIGKKRYNVRQIKVSDESGDVSGATIDSWKEAARYSAWLQC